MIVCGTLRVMGSFIRPFLTAFWSVSLISYFAPFTVWAGSGYTYFQSITGDDSDSDQSQWDSVYAKTKEYVFGKEPVPFLAENLNLLPVGKALDLAMGEGRNAVFLAKKGFDVTGVDISEVAVHKAKKLAHERGVRLRTITTDLNKYQIPLETFDVIMVFYYLQRSLIPHIIKGLKAGGVLIFEDYTLEQLKYNKSENRAYLLQKDELKNMFKDHLHTLKYKETDNGKEAFASLIARKKK